jgi:outer membrane receptor protein involved in Fe transport
MSIGRRFVGSIAVIASQLCMVPLARAQSAEPGTPAAQAQQEVQPAPPAALGTEPQRAAAAPPPSKRAAEEEILVTGSRIRRKDLTTPAPVTVINREAVQASGKVSIGDFLQSLPEQGNAINTQVNNGGNGATRVALRGLGPQRTLVLLNGRRFVPGGNGANDSVDLNSIPVAAIERIEVLKDGASAVYGSDAIGGVINIITRKRSGTEVAGFTGTSRHGDGTIYDFNGTTGASSDAGSFLFSGGYYRQQPVWGAARGFSAIPLAYDATGKNNTKGIIGPYSQGSTTVPAGTIVLGTCTSKTAASTPCVGKQMPMTADPQLNAKINLWNQLVSANPKTATFIYDPSSPLAIGGYRPFTSALLPPDGDGYNFQPDNYLVTPAQRISLYSIGDARLGSSARAYFEASFVNRQSQQVLAPEPLLADQAGATGITVTRDNAYNPYGVDLTAVRRRLTEFSNRISTQDISTWRAVGGVNGSLPDEAGPLRGWYWDLSLNYGRSEGTQVRTGNLRTTALANALGSSFQDPATGALRCGTATAPIAGCVPLNLFGGPKSITQDQIAGLTFTGTLRAINQMTSVLFNTSGELFRLFSERPVGLGAGYEYRLLVGENVPDPITVAGETTGNAAQITAGHYYVNEGYAELSVPIIGNLPFVEDLEATGAVRVSDYSTFGSQVIYKLGGRWRVIRDVTVRGTYSTGFRAPSISDLFLGQGDSFPNVSDPCRGQGVAGGGSPPPNCIAQGLPASGTGDAQTQLRSKIGGNPNLKPETAQVFTAGVVLEPRMVRNLSVTIDYYNVNVENTITTIGASTILNGCYPVDGSTPAYCNLVQRDPSTGKIQNIINLNANVGKDYSDGIDVALQYALPTAFGRFGYVFDGTWLHRYNRRLADGRLIKGKGKFDLGNTGGVYPAFKFLTGLSWAFAGFGAGVNMRYVSSFTECGTARADGRVDLAGAGNFNGNGQCFNNDSFQRRVSHYDQWDVYLSYALRSPAGKTTLAAGVNNLFDRAPSAIYNGFTAASDPTAYDFMGRFVYGRLSHGF